MVVEARISAMVKALRWFAAAVLFISLWLGLFYAPFNYSPSLQTVIKYLPFIVILCLGLISLCFIIYKVITFNDLPDEAKHLERQIIEARKSLEKAGLQL